MSDELLKALLSAQKKSSDTGWGIATQGITAALPAAVNPYGSVGQNVGVVAGGALLAGLLSGLAKSSAAEQNAEQRSAVQALLTAEPGAREQLVKEKPELQPFLSALQMEEREQARTRAQKAEDMALAEGSDFRKAQNKALLDAMMEQGRVPAGAEIKSFEALGLEDPIAFQAKKERELKKAGLEAEADSFGYNPKKAEAAEKLRKEFNALEPVKNFGNVERSARIIESALKDPGAVADQELVRYGILLIEPGMAVREGEQAALANSASIPDEWRAEMDKALNGESGLSPKTREGIKRLAMRAYDGHKTSYERARVFYEDQAVKMGLTPSSISYLGKAAPVESVFNGASSSQTIKAPDGRIIELVD